MKGKKLLVLTLNWLLGLWAYAGPTIDSLKVNSDTVGIYNKFEVTVYLHGAYTNPYNYSKVNLQAIFTSPAGIKDTIDGFYQRVYTYYSSGDSLHNTGTKAWTIRFSPTATGKWTYAISFTDAIGKASYPVQTFNVIASGNHGFIRFANNNMFRYDDSSQYFAIGENMGWQSPVWPHPQIKQYYNQMDNLSNNDGNYIRVWMIENYSFGIEWTPDSVEHYGSYQDMASQLDYIFEHAARKNIHIQLCLNNASQYATAPGLQPQWNVNPYNSKYGGPDTNPREFWADSTAQNFYKNRMRYIVARWGYSPTLLSYELFNEVDFVDSFYIEQVPKWHSIMAKYLKQIDINKHLVTTSMGEVYHDSSHAHTWENVDYTQIHKYTGDRDPEPNQYINISNYLNWYHKPVLIGECGVQGIYPPHANRDTTGINFHNMLWMTAFSGSFGTASFWYWNNYVAPNNLFYHFSPLSNFMTGVDLYSEPLAPIMPTCISPSGNVRSYALKGITKVSGWVQNKNYNWYDDTTANLPPVENNDTVLINNLTDSGKYSVLWYNCHTGAYLPATYINAVNTGGTLGITLKLPVPPLQWDYAYQVSYISPTGITGIGKNTGIILYPNPTKGIFTIHLLSYMSGIYHADIYNELGRQIKSVELKAPYTNIDLTDEANGAYIYKIISETGKIFGEGKLILEK